MSYTYKTMESPVGVLTLVAHENGLVAVLWENDNPNRVPLEPLTEDVEHPILVSAETQLQEYFDGDRKTFSIALDFIGTDFQKKVWNALLSIPYGETRSYKDIAIQLGDVKAVRAVGAANGKNPISIIAPCHRVVGTNGKLTGFAGGLEAKAFLLDLESKQRSLFK